MNRVCDTKNVNIDDLQFVFHFHYSIQGITVSVFLLDQVANASTYYSITNIQGLSFTLLTLNILVFFMSFVIGSTTPFSSRLKPGLIFPFLLIHLQTPFQLLSQLSWIHLLSRTAYLGILPSRFRVNEQAKFCSWGLILGGGSEDVLGPQVSIKMIITKQTWNLLFFLFFNFFLLSRLPYWRGQ